MKKLQKKNLKLAEVVSWGFQKEGLQTVEVQGKASGADEEAVVSYSEDAAKVTNESGYNKQISNVNKIDILEEDAI